MANDPASLLQECGKLLAVILLMTLSALAAPAERGVMVRAAQIYLAPDATSAKLATIDRGREVAVMEKSREWVRVLATVSEPTESSEGRDISGWMLDKGIIRASTPNGDKVLFGEAVNAEAEASRRGGRKGADKDALRLYYRCSEYFPQTPLAGEALYRAADIRWQLDRADVFGRPSGKTANVRDRIYGINEEWMKQVIKKFPHTKWADLAAFHLIDNKLCGEWQGQSHCPEKEADVYENYVKEHPQSPAAPEALYDAAYRRAALIEIFKGEGKLNRTAGERDKAINLAQRLVSTYPQSDYAARGQTLLYMLEQGIPAYGSAVE
ncbi:MAG: tetratricopeptide repeat protein [Terriglobales bacterium]